MCQSHQENCKKVIVENYDELVTYRTNSSNFVAKLSRIIQLHL